MAQSNLVFKNRYNNYYEAQYRRLRDNNDVFYDKQQFDDAWRKVSQGTDRTFQNLDYYINALDKAASDKLSYEQISNNGVRQGDDFLLSLFANTIADDTEMQTRERYLVDENGNYKYNADGTQQKETFEMTDKQYLLKLLDENDQFTVQRIKAEELEEIKSKQDLWQKFTRGVLAVGGRFYSGAANAVTGFMKFCAGTTQYVKELFETGSFDKAAEAKVKMIVDFDKYITFAEDFSKDVEYLERNFTKLRLADGTETTLGKYVGGVAYTLGQMMPGAVAGAGIGAIGSAGAIAGTTGAKVLSMTGKAASSLIFYEAMAADTIKETYLYNTKNGLSPNYQYIVANAELKAAAQFAVEVGISKLIGSSGLDKIVFSRSGKGLLSNKATMTVAAKLSEAPKVVKIAGKTAWYLGEDFVHEGLEEVFQDLSDAAIDGIFDALFKTNFYLQHPITKQGLADSFILGGLSSLVGGSFNIVTQQKRGSGQIKLDKNGNPIVNIEATKKQQESLLKEVDDNVTKFEELKKSEMARLNISDVNELFTNPDSMFTKEHQTYLDGVDIIRKGIESEVIYEEEMLSKVESIQYDCNMQSIAENFEKLKSRFEKIAKQPNVSEKVIKRYAKEFADFYASARIMLEFYNAVGEERFNDANEVMTFVRENVEKNEAGKVVLKASEIIDSFDKAKLESLKKYKAKPEKDTDRLQRLSTSTTGAPINDKVEQALNTMLMQSGVKTVNIVSRDGPTRQRGSEIDTSLFALEGDLEIPFGDIAIDKLVTYVAKQLDYGDFKFSKTDREWIEKCYTDVYSEHPETIDIARSLCFDVVFINEILYNKNLTKFVFNIISRIQMGAKTILASDQLSSQIKNKYLTAANNIKSLLAKFLIDFSEITDFVSYGIFTEEEYKSILNAREQNLLSKKLASDTMTNHDYDRLKRVLKYDDDHLNDVKAGLISGNNALRSILLYKLKSTETSVFNKDALSANSRENRLFNTFMNDNEYELDKDGRFVIPERINSGDVYLTNNSVLNEYIASFLDNSGISVNELTKYDILDVIAYQFSEYFDNFQLKFDNEGKPIVYREMHPDAIADDVFFETRKYDYDFQRDISVSKFAKPAFDRNISYKLIKYLLGSETTDIFAATTTFNDFFDYPSLIRSDLRELYTRQTGRNIYSHESVFNLLNSVVIQQLGDNYRLGYTNSGDVILYNSYAMNEIFSKSYDDAKKWFAEHAKTGAVYNLSDLVGELISADALFGDIKNTKLVFAEKDSSERPESGHFNRATNEIVIRIDDDPRHLVNTFSHEFHHLMQNIYGIQNGAGFNTLGTVKNGNINYYVADKDISKVKDIIDTLGKHIEIFRSDELTYADKVSKLNEMIYYNCGELFARGAAFSDCQYIVPILLYKDDNRIMHLRMFGFDLELLHHDVTPLSSKFYGNAHGILGNKNNLNTNLFSLNSKLNLESIDTNKITSADTQAAVKRLYDSLGGERQFGSLEEFYNTKLPILYFKATDDAAKTSVVATIGDVDAGTFEHLVKGRQGTIYFNNILPTQIIYFEPNKYGNVIVDIETAFSDTDIGVVSVIDGHLSFTYQDQVVNAKTRNITSPTDIELEPYTQRTFDKRKDHESSILMADKARKIANLNEQYPDLKVIRAEYGKTPVSGHTAIYYYFDGYLPNGKDYVYERVTEYGETAGKRISKHTAKSPSLANFNKKNRSKEFQEFIREADKLGLEKLPIGLTKKIKDGTLTLRNIDAYIRETSLDNLNEQAFELINAIIYKNKYIKTIDDLRTLVNSTPDIYATGVVLYILRKQELLSKKLRIENVENFLRVISEEDPKLGARIRKQYDKFVSYDKIPYELLKVFYMKHYEGTLSSAFHTANFVRIAKENDWNVTGVQRTESIDKEKTNQEGDSVVDEIEDTTNSDTFNWIISHDLTEKIRDSIRNAIVLAKKTELISKLKSGELSLSFGETLQKFAALNEEAEEWSDERLKTLYKQLKLNREELNKTYVALTAFDATKNSDYVTNSSVAEDVANAVDSVQRKPENVVRNIRSYVNSIKNNLAPAEVKKFVKLNRDLFNDDMTIKDIVLYNLDEANNYKIKPIAELLEIENRLRELLKSAKMHAVSSAEITKLKNQMQKRITDLENRLAKERQRVSYKPNIIKEIKQYVVNDIEISVNTSVQMPALFKSFLETEFDKVSKSQFRITDNSDVHHVRADLEKFYSDNAELFRTMSPESARQIAEFFVNSDAIPTTNKFSVYIAAETAVMIYILKDAHNANVFGLSRDLIQKLEAKRDNMKTMFGQGLAVIREVERRMHPNEPTRIVLKAIAKKMSIQISDDDMEALAAAVASGNYDTMAKAQANIYNKLRKQYKDVKINIFERLLQFSRAAMLSNPGTWVRNWVSNKLVTGLNTAAERLHGFITNAFDKLFFKQHEKHRVAAKAILERFGNKLENMSPEARAEYEKEYTKAKKTQWVGDPTIYKRLELVKPTKEVVNFIDKEVVSSGLLKLIEDGLSKYDTPVRTKSTLANDLTNLIANSIRSQIFTSNIKNNKVVAQWYNFIFKMLSDEAAIRKAFVKHLARTMTYDKVILTKGLTKDVMQHISDAYTLAAYEYMHKPNFVTKFESMLREKIGSAGFYVYKSAFPFLGASMNWFIEGLNYTPIGLLVNIVRYANLENTIDKMNEANRSGQGVSYRFAQYLMSRNVGKGVLGTIGFAIGAMLAGFGLARIDEEDDKLKLYIGDVYLDITDVFGSQGIMQGLAFVSAIRDRKENKYTFTDVLKFTFDQMFADSTISNTWNTIRMSDSVIDGLETVPFNMINNLIPNMISVIATTNKYHTRYEPGLLGKLEKTMLKALPSVAYALPTYIDPYTGEKQAQYKVWWLTKFVNKIGPVDIYPYNVTDNEQKALELGIHKGNLSGKYSVGDDDIVFSARKTQALNEMYGKLNDKSLTAFINNKVKYRVQDAKTKEYKDLFYKQMTDEQRGNVINRIFTSNSKICKIYALTSSGQYKYYCTKEEYQTLAALGIRKNVYIKSGKLDGFVKVS